MAIVIGNKKLNVEDIVKVARHDQDILLHEDAREKINKCRNMVLKKIESDEVIYG